jgi:hypothetical protein
MDFPKCCWLSLDCVTAAADTGTYNHVPYAVAYELAEMTFNIPYAILYFVISYWMVGFNPGAGPTIITLLFLILAYILLPSTGV